MMHPGTFKPYIAGLRAISVMGVLLFHIDKKYLPGGFLGVDVFFVLSGFLISKRLYNDIAANSFSLAGFYERRARRILPAFFAVSLSTAIAAWFWLLPAELVEFSKSLLAALTFTPNIYFYLTTNYFAPSATQVPLLHYWSLGVEEQYYLVFPVLLITLSRIRLSFVIPVLTLGFFLSLGLSSVLLAAYPPAAFYLLPARLFEILLGALLAMSNLQSRSRGAGASVIALLGVAFILGSMFFVSEMTRSLVNIVLVPCAGAALVLFSGQSRGNLTAQLLGVGPLVFLGDISYSLYLVHWPVIVFATRLLPDAGPFLFFVVSFFGSVFLGWLSYRYIEQPVRIRKRFWTPRLVGFSSATAALSMALLAVVLIRSEGFPSRTDDRVKEAMAYRYDDLLKMLRKGVCFIDGDNTVSDFNFDVCIPSGRPLAILWGDSTIAHLFHGLSPVLEQKGIRLGQFTSSACPPIRGYEQPARPNCKPFSEMAFARIVSLRPDLLILGGSWAGYPPADVMSGLGATLDAMRKEGIKIVVIGQGPRYKRRPLEIIDARFKRGDATASSGQELSEEIFKVDSEMKQRLEQLGIHYVSILETICRERQCPFLRGGKSLYYDQAHLTPEGSDYMASHLVDQILTRR